jgi:hypothetical protein
MDGIRSASGSSPRRPFRFILKCLGNCLSVTPNQVLNVIQDLTISGSHLLDVESSLTRGDSEAILNQVQHKVQNDLIGIQNNILIYHLLSQIGYSLLHIKER